MTENKPSKTPAFAPSVPKKRDCVTSFLNGKRNEMDTSCSRSQARTGNKEYVQPDEEKEAGGEA
jgi:hypothetical protein